MKSFVYHKLVHSFHQGPLNKHKVVKTVDAMVWNIKLKCKCGSVLISMAQYNTSETGSAYSICGVSPQRLRESRGPRGTEPKQDVDDDT